MALQTVVCSYQLDFHSGTELMMQVKKLLIDDAHLSKVVDDKDSWFMWMEVLDVIYLQFSLTANSFGYHTTTSQYFQPFTL